MTAMAAALYVARTGHVLGAVTRTGDPLGELTPAEVAGAAFPVRDENDDVLVEVEASELAVLNVPLIDDLLLNPQQCTVDPEAKTAQHRATTTVTVDVTGSGVKLKGLSGPQKAWVQLETGTGSGRRRTVLTGDIPENATEFDLEATLVSGSYGVLALVQGSGAVAKTDSV